MGSHRGFGATRLPGIVCAYPLYRGHVATERRRRVLESREEAGEVGGLGQLHVRHQVRQGTVARQGQALGVMFINARKQLHKMQFLYRCDKCNTQS